MRRIERQSVIIKTTTLQSISLSMDLRNNTHKLTHKRYCPVNEVDIARTTLLTGVKMTDVIRAIKTCLSHMVWMERPVTQRHGIKPADFHMFRSDSGAAVMFRINYWNGEKIVIDVTRTNE